MQPLLLAVAAAAIEFNAAENDGDEVFAVGAERVLRPASGDDPLQNLLSDTDRLVLTLRKAKAADPEVAAWAASLDHIVEEDAKIRQYVQNKKKPLPVPPAMFEALKAQFARVDRDHAALVAAAGGLHEKVFGSITLDEYSALRAVVRAAARVHQGVPLLVPGLPLPGSPELDHIRTVVDADGTVRGVRASDHRDLPAEAATHGRGYASLLRSRTFLREGDCYPVSLKDRWGEKAPTAARPQHLCVGAGAEELPEELVKAIGYGSMSDAKVTVGCAKKETAREMFDCVGTADFEKKVMKKGSLLFKNEVGRFFGDADIEAKVPSSALATYALSQKAIGQELHGLFVSAINSIDTDHYKQLAKEKKEREEEKKKEKKEKPKDKKKKKKKAKKAKKDDEKEKEKKPEAEEEEKKTGVEDEE